MCVAKAVTPTVSRLPVASDRSVAQEAMMNPLHHAGQLDLDAEHYVRLWLGGRRRVVDLLVHGRNEHAFVHHAGKVKPRRTCPQQPQLQRATKTTSTTKIEQQQFHENSRN